MMKNLLSIFGIFAVIGGGWGLRYQYRIYNASEENFGCGENEFYSIRPSACEFRCTPSGIEFQCDSMEAPGCDCDFGFYMNMETKKCSKINCQNMNCVGKANEQFFECESSRRDRCECTSRLTMDCTMGCMCKNGYCRDANGNCERRNCTHPVYS